MTLYSLMFDRFFISPFAFIVRFLKAKVSVRPHIFDDSIMNEVVKRGVFLVIGLGCTKNWIVLYESYQYWF